MEDDAVLSRASRPVDAEMRYGDLPEHVADVRYGGASAVDRPLVIMIHGGFWRPAYDRAHTRPMTAALADAGYTVAAIEYRREPGNPEATLQDVLRALRSLPAMLSGHDGRVVLTGHSAGGHLALWAALQEIPGIEGIVPLAPVADLRLAQQLDLGNGAVEAFLGEAAELCADMDPARLPSPPVPVVIVHAEDDQTVPISVARSYVASKPAVRLLAVEQADHYSLIDPLSHAWQIVVDTIGSVGTSY